MADESQNAKTNPYHLRDLNGIRKYAQPSPAVKYLQSLSGNESTQPSHPHDFTDLYNTPIPPTQQPSFDQWAQQQQKTTGRDPRNDKYDYDVQGYWLSGAATDPSGRGHGPDTFKKPNHPTFSDESKYHGQDGFYGGSWIDSNGGSFYQASPTNLNFYPPDSLKAYFGSVEPDTQLLVPPQATTPAGLK